MRIFLSFSVGLFCKKTQRIQVETTTTTDDLLEIVSKRIHKPIGSFTLTYTQQKIRIRIIKGWQLCHYNIRSGLILNAEVNEQVFMLLSNSQKNSRFLFSFVPTVNIMELQRVDEVNQEHFKDSNADYNSQLSDVGDGNKTYNPELTVLRNFLDQQLEQMLKEVRKGNIPAIKKILYSSFQLKDNINLIQKANKYKKENFINELGQNGWGAVHTAVYSQQAQVLTFLINHNANPNIWTSDGWTPLQLAVSKRSTMCAEILLDCQQVNINEITVKGTALHVAAKLNLIDMVLLLMHNKANQELLDGNGKLPIQLTNSEQIKVILSRKLDNIQTNPFIPELPPILKGIVYRQNTIYQMKQLFMVCNPFEGTLIRYEDQSCFPRKPSEVIPLSTISYVKMVGSSQLSWMMSKNYHYFQVFSSGRLIFGTKHQRIAQRWVKGIFQSCAFFISTQVKRSIQKDDLKQTTILVLDDKKNIIGNPAIKVRPRASSESPKRTGSNLLRQLSSKGTNKILQTMLENKNNQKSPKVQQSFTSSEQNKLTCNNLMNKQQSVQSTLKQKQGPQQQEYKKRQQLPFVKTTTSTMITQTDEQLIKVNFSSFQILRAIGSGSFGKVFEAKLKLTNQIFALKVLHKKHLVLRRGLKYAINQADILKQTDHPFIVKLHYTFQTVHNLYMCMDYCSRGDLSQLIAQVQIMKQSDTVKIIAQVLLAIQYLHLKNIIYRDLKPENILLCQDGFIKLADFGLCKELNQSNNCTTFCGSLAYLSPEMLEQKDVGKHTDIYGIGCVMYQLLTGEPPYYNQDTSILQSNIRDGKLKFSGLVSPLAKQLILRFLQRDISKRITIAEAKSHPFFKDIDFSRLLKKQIGEIIFPQRQIIDTDDEDCQIKNPKPKFFDVDYPDNHTKTKVPNYSFSKAK